MEHAYVVRMFGVLERECVDTEPHEGSMSEYECRSANELARDGLSERWSSIGLSQVVNLSVDTPYIRTEVGTLVLVVRRSVCIKPRSP